MKRFYLLKNDLLYITIMVVQFNNTAFSSVSDGFLTTLKESTEEIEVINFSFKQDQLIASWTE